MTIFRSFRRVPKEDGGGNFGASGAAAERAISPFEFAPAALFYFPVAAYWAWLSLRHRSFTLPTLANPAITAGGLCGESKVDVLNLFGPSGRACLAPFVSIVVNDDVARTVQKAVTALETAGIGFPIVAKPDIGRRGNGVRPVEDMDQLARYISLYPHGRRIVLQKRILYEHEAGVFYVRQPGEAEGKILSLTLKHFPEVVGDGHSTVRALILRDRRAGRIPNLYLPRLKKRLGRVLPAGQRFPLVFTGNHCKGAIFEDGRDCITEPLRDRFDRISREMPGFHFGRFDIRFRSLDDLRRGQAFSIIEVNGAGSEATHIWDRRTKLVEAYRALCQQIRIVFEIGAVYRGQGLKPMTGLALLRLFLAERRLMETYPTQEYD
jgi:hypothetical protein